MELYDFLMPEEDDVDTAVVKDDDEIANDYRYDVQLLIEGEKLDEDDINDYILDNFVGNCLLVVGDEDLIKIHWHTNEPWDLLKYCASLGEIYDIVVEDMFRQAAGKKG